MESYKMIGERIKKLREDKGETQDALAKALKVQRATVNHWENGFRDLKTEYTIKIADYYNTTCDYILRGIAPENVDIAKRTGLSDKTIKVLEFGYKQSKDNNSHVIEILNHLLAEHAFILLCKQLDGKLLEMANAELKQAINKLNENIFTAIDKLHGLSKEDKLEFFKEQRKNKDEFLEKLLFEEFKQMKYIEAMVNNLVQEMLPVYKKEVAEEVIKNHDKLTDEMKERLTKIYINTKHK